MLLNLDFREKANYSEEDELTKRVRIFTGYQCNYECGFCFYKGNRPKAFDRQIKRQAYIARLNGINSLDISGGEPTILIDWFSTLEYLKTFGFNLAVITNGSTFNDSSFLQSSIDSGLNEALFSYHGPSAEIHDSMTGFSGSYKKLFNSISNAVDLGVKIRINTVVTKRNYIHLPSIAKDMLDIQPDCFNFLPFRLENQATPENMLQYKDSIKYIKEAIDILETIKRTFISVRYLPFCVMSGYEKYLSGWWQKLFDPYEWSQHTFECLDAIRLGQAVSRHCISTQIPKRNLEFDATYEAIKATSGFSTLCMGCNHKVICEGIWKTYARVYGTEEFIPIEGEDIHDIMFHRREYVRSFMDK